jgi:hypothetical protein
MLRIDSLFSAVIAIFKSTISFSHAILPEGSGIGELADELIVKLKLK